jgi:hypothetical protein
MDEFDEVENEYEKDRKDHNGSGSEEDNPYISSVTNVNNQDMILIDSKEEAIIEKDYIKN